MSHRGGCGCEPNTGDGAGKLIYQSYLRVSYQLGVDYKGILVGMPDSYYRRVLKESQGVSLGPINSYGTGIIFTPKSDDAVAAIKDIFESKAKQFGMNIVAWRSIETGTKNILKRCKVFL